MFREGTALESLESIDSRRFLPHAIVATLGVVVVPALVVVALSPLSGLADLVLSALLATGLSVAAGSAGAALWTRRPQSREIPFGDLMLWAWARRVRAERRLARAAAGGAPLGGGELARLRTLAVVFEARDGSSHGHSGRVARHAERIARRLGLPADEVARIEAAAAVHDVGMLRVPSAVLAKDDLTPDERALIERHAAEGADRVAAVSDLETAALVRHHHERVDGGGYPDGLTGEQIPLGARIIAVADRFDELVSPNPRSPRSSRRNALDELSARAGSELDAAVVAAFVGYYSGARSIAGAAFAATAPQRAVRWIAAAPASIGAAGAPAAIQGACAAGTAVLASACLTVLPAAAPERDDRPPAQRLTEREPPGDDVRAVALPTAAGDRARVDAGERRARPRSAPGRDDGAAAPRSEAPQAPSSDGQDQGGTAPVAPTSPPAAGGERGGGSQPAPASPVPPAPAAPVRPPQPVEAPPLPPDPTSQIVDPVLDGVSETVPPAEPLNEAVKGLVGDLTGGR